ncbi:MAG: thioredoxin-dependent thiol peroxidase [Phycisphaerales bacterium]|nr:thioredoxin-dependent thiol peroxidase [Phycisphaerales bacterium]
MIEPGQPAPAFQLPDQDGCTHRLGDYAGRPLVVYFYPKDDTSGCTKEACQFRDLLPKFRHFGAGILGISPDSSASHAAFAAKHDLNFTLLADERDADDTPPVCAAYGVWQEKSMYGRTYMGVVRTTYLLDDDGVVVERWDKVRVAGHADAVLATLKTQG